MRLTGNFVATYSDTLEQEDLDAIKEDINDCLTWTGIVHGNGVIVEVKAEP